MPEGDTIHYAAKRVRAIVGGRVPDELLTPHPRFAGDRWPERLGGRAIEAVTAHGKHLFLRFEGELVVHSHLRMTGSWGTYRAGQRWRRSPRRAWLIMRAAGQEVVQFDRAGARAAHLVAGALRPAHDRRHRQPVEGRRLLRGGRRPVAPDILVPLVSDVRAKRIGHKGADHIAPGNTLASFDAALAAGVDMVEFDVLPERRDGSGRLVLAHDFDAAARRTVLTLEEGIEHFRQDAWSGVELDVDLKLPGYEQQVIDALRAAGLAERALVSTMEPDSLREIRRIAPEIRLGWSVPKLKRNYLSHPLTRPPALVAAYYGRRVMPGRAARAMRAGEIDALMAHWALVTPTLVAAVRDAGGELYVWTVDDAARIAALERLGVTGVITNDPRLFATA